MEFLDDNELSQKSQSNLKKESSTIALARKLGVNTDIVKSNFKDKDNLSPLEEKRDLIDTSTKNREPKRDKNGYLVTSEDIDRYLKKENNQPTQSQTNISEKIDTQDYIIDNSSSKNSNFIPFEFKGDAKEYFKIWIVNIALTILTLGIYSAWAKVRNNRYIYSNTYLNNSNFEYNAQPLRIFYGRLIVVGFYALFYYFSNILYNQEVALVIVTTFLLLLPWLIRQAVSFRLKSTSYRNIHFRYYGKIRDFYKLAILFLFVFILTFSPLAFVAYLNLNEKLAGLATFVLLAIFISIITPIFYLKFKELIINYASYGSTRFKFSAKKSDAIKLFFKISFVTTIVFIILTIISFVISSLFNITNIDFKSPIGVILIYIGFTFIYLLSLGYYKGISDGYLSNFTREYTTIKDASFDTKISPLKLGFISVTNIIVTIFSLGLLYPWAKMRYLRYKIENTYFKCKDYNSFQSAGRDRGSTIGEETMDFFDIDIGI